MSKISIITTTYKHKDFIAYTLESILAQTYSDWELLIGDDSPDSDTWDIIQEYVIKYPHKIKAWHHSPNKGIVDNTNFLIGKVSDESDYIAFLEGDDMYTPDNLEEKMKVFERHPEVALVYSDFECVDTVGKRIKDRVKQGTIKNNIDNKYHFGINPTNIFSWSNCLVKKDISSQMSIRNISGLKGFSISDWDFYQYVLVNYKGYHIKKTLFYYRIHNNNVSFQNNAIIKDMILLIGFYFESGYWKFSEYISYSIKNIGSIQRMWFLRIMAIRILGKKTIYKFISIL